MDLLLRVTKFLFAELCPLHLPLPSSSLPFTPSPPLQQSVCLLIVDTLMKKRKKIIFFKKTSSLKNVYRIHTCQIGKHHHQITAVSPGDFFIPPAFILSFFPQLDVAKCTALHSKTLKQRGGLGGTRGHVLLFVWQWTAGAAIYLPAQTSIRTSLRAPAGGDLKHCTHPLLGGAFIFN